MRDIPRHTVIFRVTTSADIRIHTETRVTEDTLNRAVGRRDQSWRFENRVREGRPFAPASLRDDAVSRNFTYEN